MLNYLNDWYGVDLHLISYLASRFETAQKLSSFLKMEEKREEKELTKRLSVAPQKYGEESDDSTDIDTQTPVQVKVMITHL